MKQFLFILLLLFSAVSGADTLEIIGGGLTYHVLDGGASPLYSNKVTDDGRLIVTPTIGARFVHNLDIWWYDSAALFYSTNSIGRPVQGAMVSAGMHQEYFNIGLALGGYLQNNEEFRAKGIQPFSLDSDDEISIVPLLGIEVNFILPLTNRVFLGINNLLTPILTNHTLSLGVNL